MKGTKTMKKLMMVAAATVAAWCSWGAESISVDKVSNHYPWDGKVDCVYTLSGAEAGYAYNGVFTLSVEKDGVTTRKVVTNDVTAANGTYTNTFDCTTLFGAGYYPNGGVAVSLVKKPAGVQLWAGGPYFATCNVGATQPQEYGYYFWWGDTVGYTYKAGKWDAVDGSATGFEFSNSNAKIKTYDKDVSSLKSSDFIDDSTGNLVAKYDAATAHLGAPWRIMTDAEVVALTNKCTVTWVTDWNGTGTSGRVVTGKTEGYTDKSIFLCAAGVAVSSNLGNTGICGYYWSSTPHSTDSKNAWFNFFRSDRFYPTSDTRIFGMPIRPVWSAE